MTKKNNKPSKDEKTFLAVLDEDIEYLARDKNGRLYGFSSEPSKFGAKWMCIDNWYHIPCTEYAFQFIKWEDEEPWSVRKLLEGKENRK